MAKYKVLVVEDDQELRRNLFEVFELNEFQVAEASGDVRTGPGRHFVGGAEFDDFEDLSPVGTRRRLAGSRGGRGAGVRVVLGFHEGMRRVHVASPRGRRAGQTGDAEHRLACQVVT